MKLNRLLAATAALGLLAAAAPAQARNQIKLGAQGTFALPLGDFGDVAGPGFGALLNMDMGLTQDGKLQLTGRLGYVHHLATEIVSGVDGPSFGMVPIYAGVKYFIIPGLYAGAELGPTIVLVGSTEQEVFGQKVETEGDTELEFGATIGIGYMFKDLDTRAFLWMPDLGNAGDVMSLGISIGYRFAAL